MVLLPRHVGLLGASTTRFLQKILFNTIEKLTAPPAPLVPVYTHEDCNNFLMFFLNKVRASVNPPLIRGCFIEPSPVSSWSSFTPVSLQDVKTITSNMKPSSSPADIVPTNLFLKIFDIVGPLCGKNNKSVS